MADVRLNICLTPAGAEGVEAEVFGNAQEGFGPVYDARYQVATLTATRVAGRIVLALVCIEAAHPDDTAPEACTAAAIWSAKRLLEQVIEGWTDADG